MSIVQKGATPTLASAAVSEQLKRAVDWKLFELSAHLINPNVHNEYLLESIKWFQPRHAEEVVEERHCSGLCGYPLCDKPIKASNKSSASKYRIDYYEKKIYEIERSIQYCSVSCLEKAEIWMRQLDISLPYSRPIAKPLKKANYKPTDIDEVLGVLTSVEDPNVKVTTKTPPTDTTTTTTSSVDLLRPPPPIYKAPSQLTDRGEVIGVKFVHGEPVLPTPYPFPPVADPAHRLGQPVTDNNEEPTSSTTSTANATNTTIPTTTTLDSIPEPPQHKPIIVSPPKVTPTPISANLDDIVKTMKALQIKHGLVKPKGLTATPTTVNSATIVSTATANATGVEEDTKPATNSNAAQKAEEEGGEGDKKTVIVGEESDSEDEQTVRERQDMQSFNLRDDNASRVVPHKGTRKTVEWSIADEQSTSTATATTTLTRPNDVVAPGNRRPVAATTSATGNGGGGGRGGNRVMALNVIERPTAQPLSAAALPTKREPIVSPSTLLIGAPRPVMHTKNNYPDRQAGGIEGYVPMF